MQKILRKIATYCYKPLLKRYLSKPRNYYQHPFKLTILPGVFHPAFFYSTKFLLNYLKQINLKEKTIVEVGAGNGLIAFNLACTAKKVVAIELSKIAIKGMLINQQQNKNILPNNTLQIIESNLFQAMENCIFDYIIVNPPYYPNKINNEAELAWNCGEEFEYFKNFFNQVGSFMDVNSKIIMVLSSQCNLNQINKIAIQNGFQMVVKSKKQFLIEDNFIYEITRNNSLK